MRPPETAPSPSRVPLPSTAASTSSLTDLLSNLSARLSDTETSLNVLLDSPQTLSEQLESLPLLDRAKFYVTLTYAIDSLIFCFLRIKNGANVKDHPVMQELERVKTYIRKVNAAEQVPTDRNLVVDKPAAQRMIMHSIPKHQIVPDPNAKEATQSVQTSTSRKRFVEDFSSESSRGEGDRRRPKKLKSQKS